MAKATDGPMGTQQVRTYRAEGGALTRGYGVQQGTASDQAKLSGAATRVLGVAGETAAAVDDPAAIVMLGETVAVAGAQVNAGDYVKTDTAGKWIPGNAADVETGGKALTGAAGDGDEFILFVNPNQKRS